MPKDKKGGKDEGEEIRQQSESRVFETQDFSLKVVRCHAARGPEHIQLPLLKPVNFMHGLRGLQVSMKAETDPMLG